jgi:hypothetical protein
MKDGTLTRHALIRMGQRAVKHDDLDLVMQMGTEVEGGFLVREKDYQAYEREQKLKLERARRLVGVRVVIAGNRVVTACHARPAKERRLLRGAEQREMIR